MKDEGRNTFVNTQQRVFLHHHNQSEVNTPDDEVPTGSVPHTRQEPYHEDVDSLMLAITSQGDIDIVAEETSERDMPTAPEVGDGVAAIGMTEVLVEVESHAASQSDGHIGITREVEVNLQRERHNTNPGSCQRQRIESANQELVGNLGELVGYDHLLAQTYQETIDAVSKIGSIHMTMMQFLSHRTITHNRTGYQLGEHRDIQQQVDETALYGRLPAIDVYQIGDRLEGVETDTDGQRDIRTSHSQS